MFQSSEPSIESSAITTASIHYLKPVHPRLAAELVGAVPVFGDWILKSRWRRILHHQKHLNRVSRSFAKGIEQLEPELREPVGLSYLLCRILDTIEDSNWRSRDAQAEAFSGFLNFLESAPSQAAVERWLKLFPHDVCAAEQLLLCDAARVFGEFHQLTPEQKNAISPAIQSMWHGMRFYSDRARSTGALKIRSLSDLNRYCFFVAGVVGEILTGLIRVRASEMGLSARELSGLTDLDGARFGLYLQKVNILKDRAKDESEGRFFVIDDAAVMASALDDVEAAYRYLCSIPLAMRRFRIFSGWSLFLGLLVMPSLVNVAAFSRASGDSGRQHVPSGGRSRVSRFEALSLYRKLRRWVDQPDKLSLYFNELKRMAEQVCSELNSASANSSPAPLIDTIAESREIAALVEQYKGSLAKAELLALFSHFSHPANSTSMNG